MSENNLDIFSNNAVIKVIGVGGGGSNAVNHMVAQNIAGVEFICANTDAQALSNCMTNKVIQLGNKLTDGLGAGANPDIGKRAAQEDRAIIEEIIRDADMIFITAGMGGGTGTGAAPVIAEIAREMGILTVAIVTRPFPFEGKKRSQIAEIGLEELANNVDSLITIPNEKLLNVLGKSTSLLDAFKAANNVLQGAVQGIADLITKPGLINVDFADVRTVMSEMGMAMMGTATAVGENRAKEAAAAAVASPLLEDVSLEGAKGILVNITAGPDMSIGEFEEVGGVIKDFTSEEATVVIGTVIDPEMTDELRVTVVITGLNGVINTGTVVDNNYYQRGAQTSSTSVYHQMGQMQFRNANRPKQPTPNLQFGQARQQQPVQATNNKNRFVPDIRKNEEYLDIPTFLRRQAD
ncbi:MAG: cell division protein FtsZ [Thiotrichales bacterium]|nr:MAG: cell division protein FtsZ [Thiotrichales bacterium]